MSLEKSLGGWNVCIMEWKKESFAKKKRPAGEGILRDIALADSIPTFPLSPVLGKNQLEIPH